MSGVVISLPASKSISNRALVMEFLAGEEFGLSNLSDARDTQLLQQAIKSNAPVIHLENAGTAIRFLTAAFAAKGRERLLTGNLRMTERPIAPLVSALKDLGASISYPRTDGFPPVKIGAGEMQGGKVTIDASVSSQFISALMMIGPALKSGLTLILEGKIASRPYIAMTFGMMGYFGIHTRWENEVLHIPEQEYVSRKLAIEADWSAASYFYALAVLLKTPAEIIMPGLNAHSWQGDSVIAFWMKAFGVETYFESGSVRIVKERDVAPSLFSKDFREYPDLAQTFAVLCALRKIPFNLSGLQTLRIKECDRLSALQSGLAKLNVSCRVEDGTIRSTAFGAVPNREVRIDTYDDHRMAMSFSLAKAIYQNVIIEDPEVVGKSFPGFWGQLAKLG